MRTLTVSERRGLGRTLRAHRELNELTQTALADAIDCDQTTVSRIELGQIGRPDPVVVIDAARCLGINPVSLLVKYYGFKYSEFDAEPELERAS